MLMISINSNAGISVLGTSVGEEDALLASMVTQLSAIAGEETFRNNMYLVDVIPRMVQTIKAINATVSSVREGIRITQAIKERSWNQWTDDVKTGFSQGFPGMEEMFEETEIMIDNGDDLYQVSQGNTDSFLEGRDKWDNRTLAFVKAYGNNFNEHYLFPEFFPLSSKYNNYQAKPMQDIVAKSFFEAGLGDEMREDLIRQRMFAKYMQQYCDEAKGRNTDGSILAQMGCDQMKLQQEGNDSMKEVLRILKLKFAREEVAKDEAEKQKALSDHEYNQNENNGSGYNWAVKTNIKEYQ